MMIKVFKAYYPNARMKSKEYYLNGKLHREDGPAFIQYYRNGNVWGKQYYVNGKLHREDGPAIIGYDYNENIKYKQHWLNGNKLTEQEWYNQLSAENKLIYLFGTEDD